MDCDRIAAAGLARGKQAAALQESRATSVVRKAMGKGRAAFARRGVAGGGERRGELAGGEGVEGAETIGKFGVAQAALAVKPAEKV